MMNHIFNPMMMPQFHCHPKTLDSSYQYGDWKLDQMMKKQPRIEPRIEPLKPLLPPRLIDLRFKI